MHAQQKADCGGCTRGLGYSWVNTYVIEGHTCYSQKNCINGNFPYFFLLWIFNKQGFHIGFLESYHKTSTFLLKQSLLLTKQKPKFRPSQNSGLVLKRLLMRQTPPHILY